MVFLALRSLKLQPAPEDCSAGEERSDDDISAHTLTELGLRDMGLLTNTSYSLVGLDGYGLSIVGERHITLEENA